MAYLCVHCDERFEAEGSGPPRCPKCMRVHGVQPLGAEKSIARGRRPIRWMLALVAVVAAAGGGWAYVHRTSETRDGASSPVASDAVGLLADGGGDVARFRALLASDEAVESFAKRATHSRADATGKAGAVVAALRERASAQAFVLWSRSEPRAEPMRVAAEVLAAVSRDGARAHLYPLEIVSLAVAALRSVGVAARVAEAFGFAEEKAPPDPSGRIGYFVVAVPDGAGHAFFDPTDGREGAAVTGDHTVLEDPEALGAALALEASSLLAANGDPARALALADAAVKLAPRSPSVRVARANALLSSAGVEEATRELEAASQLRDDGPRHHARGLLYAARGDREGAQREVSLALERAPDYAAAHATLALLHLSRGEREEARLSLERARALDADLPALPLAYAQLHASAGELDPALGYARQAAERNPRSPEAQLAVAGILRSVGRYDEMRGHARTALALVHASQRERTEQLIRSVLGPTALEPVETDAGAPATSGGGAQAAPQAPGKLALDQDLDLGGGSGRLKLGDGPPRLQLREPSEGLELSH